jgi:hypothetical protein
MFAVCQPSFLLPLSAWFASDTTLARAYFISPSFSSHLRPAAVLTLIRPEGEPFLAPGLGAIRGLTFWQERLQVSWLNLAGVLLRWELRMRRNLTPSIVPNGHDQTV